MGSRLTNFPLYIIYERGGYGLTADTSGTTGSKTINGDLNYLIDNDTSTEYEVISNNGNPNTIASVVFDYGRVIWNCLLTYDINIYFAGGFFTNHSEIAYSSDGATWNYILNEDDPNPTTGDYSGILPIINMRYLRIITRRNTSGATIYAGIKVRELHLLGSG